MAYVCRVVFISDIKALIQRTMKALILCRQGFTITGHHDGFFIFFSMINNTKGVSSLAKKGPFRYIIPLHFECITAHSIITN